MGNAVVGVILIAIVAVAVRSTLHRIRHGSSCCGERDPAESRVRVKDKKKGNYPFEYFLKVDGMHCANCARRIENALNSDGFRWAKADAGKKEVLLLSKREETENELGRVIAQAGYTLLTMEQTAR